MEEFPIPSVTPPLVDPLTEAANAHLAALAEQEAAEMIIKDDPEIIPEPVDPEEDDLEDDQGDKDDLESPEKVDPLEEASDEAECVAKNEDEAQDEVSEEKEASEEQAKKNEIIKNIIEKRKKKKPLKLQRSTSSSSSTPSLDAIHQELESKNSSPDDPPKLKFPIPLVEENKEPGVRI